MYNQNQMHQMSLQQTNPQAYISLIQSGIQNPDLFLQWLNSQQGMQAQQQASQEAEAKVKQIYFDSVQNMGK